MSYRTEAIQVAAVAAAMVEDLDYGSADVTRVIPDGQAGGGAMRTLLGEVAGERVAQDAKWGPQHHDPTTWLMILLEEVGEVAEEIDFDGDLDPGLLVLEARLLGEKAKAWLESR